MAQFRLSINLTAPNMVTGADVSEALMLLASKLGAQVDFGPTERGMIRDLNGNTVGLFEVADDESPAEG